MFSEQRSDETHRNGKKLSFFPEKMSPPESIVYCLEYYNKWMKKEKHSNRWLFAKPREARGPFWCLNRWMVQTAGSI